MTDIFADGIRSIAVANGVLRIELFQMKHVAGESALKPEPAGSLYLPIGGLKDVSSQLAGTLERLQQAARPPAAGPEPGGAKDG